MKRAIGIFLLAFITFALIAYQLEWYDFTFIERPEKDDWDDSGVSVSTEPLFGGISDSSAPESGEIDTESVF